MKRKVKDGQIHLLNDYRDHSMLEAKTIRVSSGDDANYGR